MADASVAMKTSNEDEEIGQRKLNNYRKLLDSDSDEEKETQQIRHNASIKSNNSDADNEDRLDMSVKKSRIISQASSSDESNDEAQKQTRNRRKNTPKKRELKVKKSPKIKKKAEPAEKAQRKSAVKAMEVIKEKMTFKQEQELKQKIQSQKQRMDREQEIRVPYHKPKQYTLKQFLSRRTINQPSMSTVTDQKPMSSALAMKMSAEQLEKFAQKLKEREEEAVEFFRSESENSDSEPEVDANKGNNSMSPKILLAKIIASDSELLIAAPKTVKSHCEMPIPPIEGSQIIAIDEKALEMDKSRTNISDEVVQAEKTVESMTPQIDSEIERLREKYANVPEDSKTDIKPKINFPTLRTLREMGPKDMIDLEHGTVISRKLTGPEILFQTYLKSVHKPKHKDSVALNILSTENGKLESQKIEVKLDKEIEIDHSRPGLAREKFKENLRSKIVSKRLQEIKRKIEIKQAETASAKEDEWEEKSDCGINDGTSKHDSEDDFDYDENEKPIMKQPSTSEENDDEVHDEEEQSEDESNSSSSSDEEEEQAEPKKGRILKAFADSDDENSKSTEGPVNSSQISSIHEAQKFPESEDFYKSNAKVNELPYIFNSEVDATQPDQQTGSLPLEYSQQLVSQNESNPKSGMSVFDSQLTDFTFTEPSVSERMRLERDDIKAICDSGPSQMMDEDLMEICSGRFATQPQSMSTQAEDPTIKKFDDIFIDSQLSTQIENEKQSTDVTSPKIKQSRILLESSDDEIESAKIDKKKRLKKKRKQKAKKLGFSDDEAEETSNQAPYIESAAEDVEECEEEQEEVLVDYDSEENEIEVRLKEKDRVKVAGTFLEKEAELSESDWGSADEDEKGLDKFDIELGDEDEFDVNQLREEVGRIHARKMLDDDIRNVKKIEELLFEDEENDGVGRDRKFRWKNQSEGFTLEDENARDADNPENIEDDDDNEAAWRLMRHERESIINEQSQKMTESESMSEDILLLDQCSQTATNSNLSKRKFRIIKSTSSVGQPFDQNKKQSPFLIKMSNMKKFQKSSFLSRGEDALKKIASFMSHSDEITNVSSHGGNSMSFMTIEKPDDTKKRKSDTIAQTDASNKKRKIEKPKSNFLLDQLN